MCDLQHMFILLFNCKNILQFKSIIWILFDYH